MRNVTRVTLAVAALALAVGCTTTIDGRPVPGPGAGPPEPTFPTRTRPPVATPTTSAPTTTAAPTTSSPPATSSTPATSTPPAGGAELPADADGLVFIATKSGKTRCQISVSAVACEAAFTDSPLRDGQPANGVQIGSDGGVEWVLGNLGAIPTVTLDYRRYLAQGWTIDATFDGTRFTNDGTGHGMFVSIDRVDTF